MSSSKSLCDKCGYSPLASADAQIPEAVSPELLSSKQLLVASDAEKVRETMHLTHCRIARLDEEISRIATVLDDLRSRREDLHTFAATHAALIAPVRKIPMELLHNILLKCMGCERPKEHPKRHLDQTPLILASVCRTWRNATISLPIIWSDIRFCMHSDRVDTDVMILRMWLQRSGDHALAIHLSSSDMGQISPLHDKPILDVIIPTSNRWKELHIRKLNPESRRRLLDKSRDYHMLHSLEFTSSAGTRPFDISRNAPLLRTLTIHRPSSDRLGIPWAQLKELSFRATEGSFFSNSKAILDILALSTNLNKLIMPYYIQGSLSYNPRSISLPMLSSLAFRISQGLVIGTPADFLAVLDLPALKEVSFDLLASATGVTWRTSPDLLALLSCSPVTSLTIAARGETTSSVSDEDLIVILQALPGLRSLHLSGAGIRCTTTSFFNRLSYKPYVPILVPMLRHISFPFKQLEYEVDIAAVVDAMESRAKYQPNVLTSVTVHSCSTEDNDRLLSLGSATRSSLDRLSKSSEASVHGAE